VRERRVPAVTIDPSGSATLADRDRQVEPPHVPTRGPSGTALAWSVLLAPLRIHRLENLMSIEKDATPKKSRPHPLPAGTPAPDFTLPVTPDQRVSLSDFRGQPVILAFYPADFSPVCGDEMALFNQILPEFRRYNAELLGISVDNVWSHLAFEKDRNLHFPLLSDFNPKGAVSKEYGVYQDDVGESGRGLFVVDADGVIRWSYLSPVGINPGADGVLNALDELQPQAAKKGS
jgi:peroxiredoxin